MSAGAHPPKNMMIEGAINPCGRSPCQPPARSYIDGQMSERRVQAPAVAISPTAPWTRAGNGLGSQLPKPVKAAAKNDEDILMQEAEDPSSPKTIQKSCNEHTSKEPEDVELCGHESRIPPVSSKVVISQASPLKRVSMPADGKAKADIPDNPRKHSPSIGIPNEAQNGLPSCTEAKKVLSVCLNGTFPPGMHLTRPFLKTLVPRTPAHARVLVVPLLNQALAGLGR